LRKLMSCAAKKKPTTVPSPTVLGVTMYVLYEFSIVLIRVGGR
jgi:Sec-independent protein secretion pathway component TatC